MKRVAVLTIAASCLMLAGCADVLKTLSKTLSTTVSKSGSGGGLTTADVVQGLKEALTVGATNSTALASKVDGFNLNSLIRIPFPPEAIAVKNAVEKMGLSNLVKDFEVSLNRAAEEASKRAFPIFKNAVLNMSFSDAMGILKGNSTAATTYLKNKTQAALVAEFSPVVKNAIQTVNVTRYWTPVVNAYNKTTVLTGRTQVNPNLDQYVTQKALDGLFYLVGQEEKKIRENPAARVTEILRKVFGAK